MFTDDCITSRVFSSTVFADPFEKACNLVSFHIGLDWVKLYRALPFHPFRGHHEIERDLASIDVTRGNPRELALRSLNKWRRIHSRAKLDDLNQALRVVGRGDLLEKLNKPITAKAHEDEIDVNVYSWLDPKLVPFYKQVQRFDQLRHASKHKP